MVPFTLMYLRLSKGHLSTAINITNSTVPHWTFLRRSNTTLPWLICIQKCVCYRNPFLSVQSSRFSYGKIPENNLLKHTRPIHLLTSISTGPKVETGNNSRQKADIKTTRPHPITNLQIEIISLVFENY